MTRGRPEEPRAADGVVEWFDTDEGWGVVTAPEAPGGCFVHFSAIDLPGYRELHAGQRVRFTFTAPGQDGCAYRALTVSPLDLRPAWPTRTRNRPYRAGMHWAATERS